MDHLSNVLSQFSLSSKVFFSGNLCGLSRFDSSNTDCGHLHFLKSGELRISNSDGTLMHLEKPSVIFFPRATKHHLRAEKLGGANIVCAEIRYRSGFDNPLTKALPAFLHCEVDKCDRLGRSAEWLFEEAFAERLGRDVVLEKICDIFLIEMFRKVIAENTVKEGIISGLADSRIALVLSKIHEQPQAVWKLENMADIANMSRSKFSALFKEIVGQTPGEYLLDWRMTVAQKLIVNGQNIDLVAHSVGYENSSALARAFRKKTGLAPKEWARKKTGA